MTSENLYEESSESGSGWIQWFCDLEGHEFFIEVDEDYIRDNFNLHGLRERVTYFK
jgi:casein kinase II subunit beta